MSAQCAYSEQVRLALKRRSATAFWPARRRVRGLARSHAAYIADRSAGQLRRESGLLLCDRLTRGRSALSSSSDLLTRRPVARLITPSGRTLFQVSGAGAPYLVSCGPTPYAYHCGCASFAHGVLATSTHVVCKHLLACLLGQRLGRCVDRAVGFDYLATVARGFTLSDDDAGT